MQRLVRRLQGVAAELQRRGVYRAVVLYAVTLFVLLQIADATFEPLGIANFWVAVLVVGGVAGLPIAIVLAWLFDVTGGGIRKVDPGPFEDVLARTPLRRVSTILGTAVASALLGWGTWQFGIGVPPVPAGPSTPADPRVTAVELSPRRIAVLYLDDHSEDGSLGYLAAELTEGLLHELSNVEGLDVLSRNAVKPFRFAAVSTDSIVRALRVGSLVEGSVTRSGNRVRATVQLIDGTTLTHLDSRMVDGSLDDPFAFQDSLTTLVARQLRQRLGQEIVVRLARAGTDDPRAWTAYARGRDEIVEYEGYRKSDPAAAASALLRADSLLRVARDHDPDWVEPLVQRAVAVGRLAALRAPLPGAMDTLGAMEAEEILETVLNDDPEHAGALAFRGWVRARLARTPGLPSASQVLDSAERDLRQALAIDAALPGAWWTLSEVLVRQGRFLEAVEAATSALEEDAFLEVEEEALFSLQYSVSQLGPSDDALDLCNEGRRRFPLNPNFVACRFVVLGSYPQADPDVRHARALLDSLLAASPSGDRETWRLYGTVWLARVMARAGQVDSAIATLARVREPGHTPPTLAYDEAHIQLLLGRPAEAVQLLRSYLSVDPDTAFIRQDWWFEDLRDYPPFRELVGLGADPDRGR